MGKLACIFVVFWEINVMATGISDFLKFNLWANLRMLDTCAQLTDEQMDATIDGMYGSIRDTLVHIFRAEEGYARHFNFTSSAPTPLLREFTTFPGFDELRSRAERSGKELIAVAERADLDQVLHLDGGNYDVKVIIVLIQAVDHGIDHRSQIATLLSQQGITPPEIDAWSYNDDLS
jgi:uncharacterized damage-inducible protein DinB